MKKILVSLAVIAAAAAVVVGVSFAYFSDQETSTGNTFTAGTIDIAIDGNTVWNQSYSVPDLKPGEKGNLTFNIQNVGMNPVDVSKTLNTFVTNGGLVQNFACGAPINGNVSSDPECDAEKLLGQRQDNIQTQIVYDLDVKVYANSTTTIPMWWQTIYADSMNRSIASIYGPTGGTYVKLGMIPVGGHMIVTQSYKFSALAGNEYQGDGLTFNMIIKAEQLATNDGQANITLENKGGAPDWLILIGDGINGLLTYNTVGPTFNFTFTAVGLVANGNYTLLYPGPTGDFPGVGSLVIGTGTATAGGTIAISGSPDLGTLANAKVWLIPSGDYNTGTNLIIGWNNSQNLYETALINYVKN